MAPIFLFGSETLALSHSCNELFLQTSHNVSELSEPLLTKMWLEGHYEWEQTCSALQLEIDTSFFNTSRKCKYLEHGHEGRRGLRNHGHHPPFDVISLSSAPRPMTRTRFQGYLIDVTYTRVLFIYRNFMINEILFAKAFEAFHYPSCAKLKKNTMTDSLQHCLGNKEFILYCHGQAYMVNTRVIHTQDFCVVSGENLPCVVLQLAIRLERCLSKSSECGIGSTWRKIER